jgi:hypothetical protein
MTGGHSNAEVSSIADNCSLVTGGPFYRALRGMGLFEPHRTVNRVVAWLVVTWVPLLVLTLAKGTAWGDKVKIPLLQDYSIYGRFLVALPLLIMAEVVIDPYMRRVISTFNSSGIIREESLLSYRAALEKLTRLRDSALIELVLALLSFTPFFLFLAEYEWGSNRVSSWHGTVFEGLSPAGWWFVLVSSPFVRFLMFRWVWRYVLWIYVLRRVSKLKLVLLPTHPDRLGGLGFLLFAQQQFAILAAALGSVLAGQFANEIVHFGIALNRVRAETGIFIASSVFVILLPLTLFSIKLFETRRDGLVLYSVVARGVTGRFDTKWIEKPESPPDAMIGTQDPSSLIDYISSFDVIQAMRVIPISRRTVLYIAAYAAAPFAVVWFLHTPLDQLIAELLKRLL